MSKKNSKAKKARKKAKKGRLKVSLILVADVGFVLVDKKGRRRIWDDCMIDLCTTIAEGKNKFGMRKETFDMLSFVW